MTLITKQESEHWNEEEIKKAARILNKAEKSKSLLIKFIDKAVLWFLVLIVFMGNSAICALLVLVSIFSNTLLLYLTMSFLAIGFGVLVSSSLKEIEKIDKGKHFLTFVMIILITFTNVYMVYGIASYFSRLYEITVNTNVVAMGITYAILFLLPFFRHIKK